MLSYSDWKDILKNERLPTAVVDLDAFDRNTEKIAKILTGKKQKLRIATKSIRVPALIERVLKSGSPYSGIMCYSAEEAFYLAGKGVSQDILIAYPTVQKRDLILLREIHERGIDIKLTVDNFAAIQAVERAMKGSTRPFRLVLDVDMSLRYLGGLIHLGVRRSPIRSKRNLVELIQKVQGNINSSQVEIAGMMGYEAQVAGLGDRNPFKKWINPIAACIRRLSVKAGAKYREDLAKTFMEQGLKLEFFNGGGTGSFSCYGCN